MNDVLDRLRQARPVAAAPSPVARSAARQRLLAVIEDEPVGLHARRAHRVPSAGRDGSAAQGARRRRPDARRPLQGRRVVGGLASLAVAGIAAAVVVVALAATGQHRPVTSVQDAGEPGLIDARDGQALGQGATGLPAVVAAGLRSQYQAQLSGGHTLQTTIDGDLQTTAMRSLRHSVTTDHAAGGTVVAMNPQTGAVQAIATIGPKGREARVDGAVSDPSATGGAFLPVTDLAALQTGVWTPSETYDDTGKFCLPGSVVCLRNSAGAAYGTITLPRALAIEDDVFAYQLAAKLNSGTANGGALQQTARQLGIGRRSGIDLPAEANGALPTPATPAHNPPRRRWSLGDALDLAVGQGQLTVTPVQLAVAYAAIANGGTIITPHLATAVTAHGSSHRLPAWRTHRLGLARAALATVRAGLSENATSVAGSSSDVFRSLHTPVAGAVGTSQSITRGHESDTGWYAGYLQDAKHPLVVIVKVQGGGFGDVSASPVARQLFSQWTAGHPGPWTPGRSASQ